MQLMNEVLRPFLDDFILIYLDDILIFSTSWEEHMEHVEKVLEMLKHHRLWLNRKKCEFLDDLLWCTSALGGGETYHVREILVQHPDHLRSVHPFRHRREISNIGKKSRN